MIYLLSIKISSFVSFKNKFVLLFKKKKEVIISFSQRMNFNP